MTEMSPAELIFFAAAEKPRAERDDYLAAACGEDTDLRRRVERMLAARPLVGDFLEPAPSPVPARAPDGAAATADFAGAQECVGAVIAGKYKLIEEIGEGGMGSVFMAQQREPVKRAVAVKVIKAGMDSKAVLARFEAERQALAMMDHPNIARVLDAGTTESGRPFFVMELVKGTPITEYCDERKLTTRQRLELFVPVCQAIQHAHQKGVVHRDIKPSNVLVALYDDRPVPKVIDFGIAKAAGQSLTDKTLMTGFGAVVGTPEYMSPEQANLNNLDIDTRSDVYSLGVLLYELLTGSTPVDRKSIGKAAVLEVLRIVREVEAPRPSARLSTINTLASIAASRGTEPAKLSQLMKGELDWVVLKALEKDRTRRYDTANGLARDIQRYLADEVVEARPPSAGYLVKMIVRRNKGKVLAAGLLLGTLILGITGTTWGLLQARAERDRTEIERQNAVHERDEKEKARQAEADRAEGERLAKIGAQAARDNEARERSYAEAIANFVKDDFLALTSVEGQSRFGGEGLTRNATLRELLDRAAEKLNERKGLAPRTEAELCWIIGVSYRSIGDALRAIPFLERSVELNRQVSGPDGDDTIVAKNSLVVAYGDAGKLVLAQSLSEENFRFCKAKLGGNHPDTLTMMMNLVSTYKDAGKLDLALPLAEENCKLMKAAVGADHPAALQSMSNLALCYLAAGKLDKALPLLVETLQLRKSKLGADHPATLNSMAYLASGYQTAGKLTQAVPLLEETQAMRRSKLGADHPATLASMATLALGYKAVGKLDLALPLFEETLKLIRAKRGADHPDTLNSMSNLAGGYHAAGKLDLALPLFIETLGLQRAKLGADHPNTLSTMNNLAVAYNATGKSDLALPLYEEALRLRKKTLGTDHLDTLSSMANLAEGFRVAGKLDLAVPLSEESFQLMTAKLGVDHPNSLTCMNNLALSYYSAKRLDKAIPLFEECLRRTKIRQGTDHSDTLNLMNNLASAYQDTGKLNLALPLYEETLKLKKVKLGIDHPQTLTSMNNLAEGYIDNDRPDLSIPLYEESLKLLEAKFGRQHPDTLQTIFKLGVSCKLAGRLTDAIPLLEEAYGASKQQTALPYARRNLLDAYHLADKNQKALSFAYEFLAADHKDAAQDRAELAADLSLIGRTFLKSRAFLDAEPVLRECLAIREKLLADEYITFNTRSALGEALLGQKKYADAEPLLLQGFLGMKEREKFIPQPFTYILADALDRLIQLYTETDKPDEVKKWQSAKDKLPKTAEKKD